MIVFFEIFIYILLCIIFCVVIKVFIIFKYINNECMYERERKSMSWEKVGMNHGDQEGVTNSEMVG